MQSTLGNNTWVLLTSLALMLLLAGATYVFVEKKALSSGFLSSTAKAKNPRPFVPRDILVGAVALGAIVLFAVAQIRGPSELVKADSLAAGLASVEKPTSSAYLTQGERESAVKAANNAKSWPSQVESELDLLFSGAAGAPALQGEPPGCMNSTMRTGTPHHCGDAESDRVLVLGDSAAMSWVPTIDAYAQQRGLGGVVAMGFGNCSLFDFTASDASGTPGFGEACEQRRTGNDVPAHRNAARYPVSLRFRVGLAPYGLGS